MYTINEAEKLISLLEIDFNEKKSELTNNSTASDLIITNLLGELLKTSNSLLSELAIEKYKIAFIGTIGSGKTTAICHLLNLIFERNVEKTINKQKRPIPETTTVLATASGGTTLCEVEIKKGDITTIELIPYEDPQKIFKDFSEFIISKVKNKDIQNPDNDTTRESLPDELQRAIRNFVKLPERGTLTSSNKGDSLQIEDEIEPTENTKQSNPIKTKNQTADKAMALYRQMIDKGYTDAQYIDEIINLANLAERNIYTLQSPSQTDELNWLYETFLKINVGTYPNMVFPERIVITLASSTELSMYEAIIDTKGLNNGAPRSNISTLMEDIGTICIFTTLFAEAPNANISEFLKRSNILINTHHFERYMLLVLPRKNDAEHTLQEDGTQIGDFEEGSNIKRNTILNDFSTNSIKLNENQIQFYNPLRYYDDDFMPKKSYIPDIKDEKSTLFNEINKLISNKRQNISDRFEAIKVNYEILRKGSLSEQDISRLNRLKEELKEHRLLNFVTETFKTKLIDIFRYTDNTKHHRTKHTLNSNEWVHPYSGADVLLNFKDLYAKKTLKDCTFRKTEEIKQALARLASPDGASIFIEVSKQMMEIFIPRYNNFLSSTSDEFETLLKNHLNDDFFQLLIDEYGLGSGYTDRICDHIARWIDINKLREKFELKANDNWKSLIDNFAQILQ